ncbi:tRNA (adenosine(37)-N6)-dimethylallyltransferase MiaA [Parvibaculum sp.]|uniref:tRNA (adenosine(37)-N6)-dimethylallyltransferase MiaA n=1 Tax=Parvibaculum sp. TaxID=2024848 RepID=UPI002730ED0C|nr:tRNA (adenosine(37)-N6)-dimethylallyltransferase MiaA [Parvibaculum sp.]MDP1627017.1 tRNA (adenosine(37)-N6)-dimethylallyltransferase MiaA [Parvibaculum sp.]MDP2149811.1 tRNA (adenosine(37)-N6)-dimethylallyltransferase MiaA [Parvibaculum sp.]MDP3327255.1 tRNA (adenosine(37)-N6)-dimethylallyltransferase MiaA [Parvibaculum sp.]
MSEPVGRAVLIAGPTASGKSGLALALAERLGGEIVNADSMQVYREMRVLTARPSAADEARVPHHLYGVTAAAAPLSAGRWAVLAAAKMREIAARGRVPVVVGGTGLYFRALVEGLAPIPPIPDDIRAAVRAEVADAGPHAHALLAEADPALAAGIRPSDRQRIARGIEVARATGRPLSAWQQIPPEPLVSGTFAKIMLMPDRAWLQARCDFRFDLMLEEGALEEAAAMAALGLDPLLPAMKALGLRPLIGHLAGEIGLEEAATAGKAETRAYAKRQETWLRTQMIAWNAFSAQDSESLMAKILPFIDDLGLTRS